MSHARFVHIIALISCFFLLAPSARVFASTPQEVRVLIDKATRLPADDSYSRLSLALTLSELPPEQIHSLVTEQQISALLAGLSQQHHAIVQKYTVSILSLVTPAKSPQRDAVGRAVAKQLLFDRQADIETHAPKLAKALEPTLTDPALQENLIGNFYKHTDVARKQIADRLAPTVSHVLQSVPRKNIAEWRELAATLEIASRVPVQYEKLGEHLWNFANVKCPVSNCLGEKNQAWAEVTRAVNGIAADAAKSVVAEDETLRRLVRNSPPKHWAIQNPPLPWENFPISSYDGVSSDEINYESFLHDSKYRDQVLADLVDDHAPGHEQAERIASHLYSDFANGRHVELTDAQMTKLRKSLGRMENVDIYWNAWNRSPIAAVVRNVTDGSVSEGDWEHLTHGGASLPAELKMTIDSSVHKAPPGLSTLFPELSQDRYYLEDLGSLNPIELKDTAAFNVLAKWTSELSDPLKQVYGPKIKKLFGEHFHRAIRDVANGKSTDFALVRHALEINESVVVVTEADASSLAKIFLRTAKDFDQVELKQLAMKTLVKLKTNGAVLDDETVRAMLGEIQNTSHVKKIGPFNLLYDRREAPFHAEVLSLLDTKELTSPEHRKTLLAIAKTVSDEKRTAAEVQRLLTTWPHGDEQAPRAAKLLGASTAKFGSLPARCAEAFSKISR